MDPLTHTATGLFLSRAGLQRWTPLATPILLLAANAPDCDIATLAGGQLNYLHYHRHLTHSLAAMPVMALLPVVLVRVAARKPVRWMGAWAAAMVAVATHLALDLTNAYGVRLLLPFSQRWLRLDLTSLIDLWIWAVLLLAIAAPFLGRLVGSEITSGAAKQRGYGRGWAVFALAFLLIYNYGRSVLHARALSVLDSRIYRGQAPSRVTAVPDAASPWKWRGIVETADFYAVDEVNLLGDFDPTQASIVHKPEPDPAFDAAARTRTFQEFLAWTQYPVWRVSPVSEPENARLVELTDMRFTGFVASAVVTAAGKVVETQFTYGMGRRWARARGVGRPGGLPDFQVQEAEEEQRREQVDEPVHLAELAAEDFKGCVGNEAEGQPVGDAEAERDCHHRQECRNGDFGVGPIDLREYACHEAAYHNQSGRGGGLGDDADYRRDEERQNEKQAGDDGGDAGAASGGDSGGGFDVAGDGAGSGEGACDGGGGVGEEDAA